MSKKLLAIAALALVPLVPVHADNASGCGVGTMIMEGKSGMVFHVLAATTNGSLGNQTFGMTSGTLGCKVDGPVTANADLIKFASANLDQLAAEMATGEGEALTAFATLYGVEAADRPAFFALTKAHYTSIIDSDSVTAGAVVATVKNLMAGDARLSRYSI